MDTPRRALISLLPALLVLPACDGAAEPDGLRITAAALAPCASNENGDRQFPSNADKVVVRLTGGDIPADAPIVAVFPAGSEGDEGQVVLGDLPPGEGMTLEVAACLGAEPTWGGLAGDVAVVAGETNPVDLFLTPVDRVACVGFPDTDNTEMSDAHAFGATWGDRDAGWILGGFSRVDQDGASQVTFTATNKVVRYDRGDSAFEDGGALGSPRAMAAAQPLADGRLRIVGGVRTLSIGTATAGAPLRASGSEPPTPSVEIFDPVAGTSEAGPEADLPALPAVAALDDGRTIAVGGVDGGDQPAAVAWVIGQAEATSLDLPQGRYGATVVAGEGGQALVWGGNADGDPANVALWIDPAGEEPVVPLGGETALGVPFMAAGAFLGASDGRQRFLVVGGTDINQANPRYTPNASTLRILLVEVDPTEGTYSASPLDPPDGAGDLFRRAAATLVEVDTGDLLLLGGFTSFSKDPACGGTGDCLQQTIPRFRVGDGEVTLVGEPDQSNVGTLGATLAALGDGSWLLGGGLRSVTAGAIDTGAGLLRFRVDDPGLCAHSAPR